MVTCLNCGHEAAEAARYCPTCGTQMPEQVGSVDSLDGRTLNEKYRLVSKIGSGSMGTVYLGEHLGLKKKVALKILHPDHRVTEDGLQRFQREGIAAGKFNHPNAIQIFDFDKAEGGIFYLAMEFVEGKDLKAFLRDHGAQPVRQAVDLIRQVLGVLTEAHLQGIVHRDLKPENIMVVRGAGGLTVKVLDFGLSKLLDRRLDASLQTEVGRIMGTPMYMSPEQCAGEDVDHRSDLYAVGLILYELLTGDTPFQAETMTELLIKQASQPPPPIHDSHPNLDVPTGIEDILLKALEKKREDRFQSAAEMLKELDGVRYDVLGPSEAGRARSAARADAASAEPSGGGRAGRAAPAKRWRALIATGVLFATVAGFGWMFSQKAAAKSRYSTLLDDAQQELVRHDPDAALALVDEALEMGYRDARAYLLRGLAYREREDDDTARADFEEAIDIDPTYVDPVLEIGWMHFDRGEHLRALQRFEEAAEMDAESGEAHAGKAAVLRTRGEVERALKLLRNARDLDPESTRINYHLGTVLLETDDAAGAVDAFVAAKRRDSKFWPAYVGLGEAYLRTGRVDESEKQLREALVLSPGSLAAQTTLASLLVGSERFIDAADVLERAVQRHPDEGELQILWGVTQQARGRDAEAIPALEQGLELGGGDAQARLLLGILYQTEDREREALEQYDAAIEIDDTLALAHLNRGLALYRLGRFPESEAPLLRAVELDPDNAYAHLALGMLYMEYLGNGQRAVAHLERYRELDGSDDRLRTWLARYGR